MFFKQITLSKDVITELKPGRVYILFVDNEEVARSVKEAIDIAISGLEPRPKILILPVTSAKPRILYFE